ncbi:MAG: DUF1697 domain-containing protein [Terriglobia bacterium]
MRYLALLRGINVGGKNKLPMKALKEIFAANGCANIVTFIQSGNVIFDAAAGKAGKLPAILSAAIEAGAGLRIPVVLRTAAELDAAVHSNPFLKAGADEDKLHIMFLADQPDSAAVAKLDPDRSPPDAFAVVGREIYLHTPNGVGNSRLTNAWFDSRLSTIGTSRNWRTCLKLNELMKS